jgi:HK97 family phage prohead protease
MPAVSPSLEVTPMLRSFGLIQKLQAKARTWHAVLTSGVVDRVGDRVYVQGMKLDDFLENPVCLAQHDQRSLPIGRWENLRVVGSGWNARLEADLVLADEGTSETADEAAGLIEQRILRGVSIGFTVQRSEANEEGGADLLETTLLEASVVSIPANAEALLAANLALAGRRPTPTTTAPAEQRLTAQEVREIVLAAFPKPAGIQRFNITPAEIRATVLSVAQDLAQKAVARARGRLED